MNGEPIAMGPILALWMLACLSPVTVVLADEPPVCLPAEGQPICTCDLTKLRPLQGAVGMEQVISMEKRIADDPRHARRRLEEDPIKVIAGVGGELFIIDHHHTAEAWLRAKTEWGANALCKIVNSEKGLPPDFKTEDKFWAALKAARLVRLKNESGVDVENTKATTSVMVEDRRLTTHAILYEQKRLGFVLGPSRGVDAGLDNQRTRRRRSAHHAHT
jgi:hypothetical protein